MNRGSRVILLWLLFVQTTVLGLAQDSQSIFLKRMQQYEHSVLNTYLEYQKLYYEDKSRLRELEAFEELLTVYINQVMEIYETLNLSEKKTQLPRDIAARTLVFKALMFLEKAPLNVEYYEKACYDYYEALNLYEGSEFAPVIYKDLPQVIKTGEKTYFRLIDLLEDKGKGLENFGKVKISFRNFMVTANFDPEKIELVKINHEQKSGNSDLTIHYREYTYLLAESRIKRAFSEVFKRTPEVETYVALPAGTYVLQLSGGKKPSYSALTRFYVRPNQEHHYIMEPLADWIILYENPTSKRPDYYKFRRNRDLEASEMNNLGVQTDGHANDKKGSNETGPQTLTATHEKLVAEIVAEYLPQFEIKLMFDLNNPEIKANAIQIISHTIVEYVQSLDYYNNWNHWTASWEISKKIREVISPGSLVPIELVELVHKIIQEF